MITEFFLIKKLFIKKKRFCEGGSLFDLIHKKHVKLNEN